MRGIVLLLVLSCGILLAGVAFLRADGGVTDPDTVQIAAQEDGGYLITTVSYQARIGSDGNLRSVSVNGVEFLDDRTANSLGASFFVEQPITLPTLRQQPRDIMASNETYAIRYHFEPGYIQLFLKHANPQGAAYVAVFSEKVAYIEDLVTNTVAAVPADYQWTDVRVTAGTGEYLKLQYGSRIWGREVNHQIWECSNIVPEKEYTLMLVPGRGKPPTPGLEQLTNLSVTMNRADQLIPAGEPVTLNVRFDNNSNQLVTTEMAVSVDSSRGTTILSDRKPLVCEAHRSVTLTWTLTPDAADFYRLACSANLGGGVKRLATTFGYDIPSIRPSVQRPDDFSAYWEHIVAEAKAAELTITQNLDAKRSTSTVKVFEVIVAENGERLFSGWLSVPRFPGRYPGLLILPADRATAIMPTPSWAEPGGFVVFCLDPTNQDNIKTALKPLISFASTNYINKSKFGMRPIVIRCLQAITVLASVKEVDPNRLAVTGYGLGGSLAMMLASVDERVQAVAPDVPYYCHIALGSTRDDWPYPEVADFLRANPEQREAVMTTLSYYDVANFAESITCPVLISAGINDSYSRPVNITGVYNRLPGPRALSIYLAGHEGGGRVHLQEKFRWLRRVLGGPGPVPPVAVPDTPAAPAREVPETPPVPDAAP